MFQVSLIRALIQTKMKAYPASDRGLLTLGMGSVSYAHQICALILTKGRVYPAGDRCWLVLGMGSASCAYQICLLILTKWKVYPASNGGLVTPAPQCCYLALEAERVAPVCRNNV